GADHGLHAAAHEFDRNTPRAATGVEHRVRRVPHHEGDLAVYVHARGGEVVEALLVAVAVPCRHGRSLASMHEGGLRAIIAAFLANLGIAAAKFVGFVFTGSA